MVRYSVFSLVRNAFSGHENWPAAWRSPDPKEKYDVVIVGGGGHGLATAYYLAKEHGLLNVAVLEKGWLGGGNTGRNTTIVRSNYLLEPNARFYEHAMKLWEGLSRDLNFNVMYSPRGVLNLAHSDPQIDAFQRRGNAMRLNGIDAEWLNPDQIKKRVPLLDRSARTFAAGHCAQTKVAGINILIHALEKENGFDIYVAKGFALSLWEWLTDAAGKFGFSVERPLPS